MGTLAVTTGWVVVVSYVALFGGLSLLLRYVVGRARGADPLGPGPEGSLPDTTIALVVACPLWVIALYLTGAALGRADMAGDRVIAAAAQEIVNLVFALALLPFATRGGLRPTLPRGRLVVFGLLGGLASFGLAGMVGMAIEGIADVLGYHLQQQGVVEQARQARELDVVVLGVTAIVLAPFAEEVFFRGILFPAFARVGGVRSALLVQAAIFGAIHVVNAPDTWPLAIPLGVVGYCLGTLYVRTGSLVVPVLAHATFNAINFALLRASTGT